MEENLKNLNKNALKIIFGATVVICIIWLGKDIWAKHTLFIVLDLSVIFLTIGLFLLIHYNKLNKKVIATYTLVIMLSLFIIIFYYKACSLIFYFVPLILGNVLLLNHKKDKVYIQFLFLIVVVFTLFFYLTLNIWPQLRAKPEDCFQTDFFDDLEAVLMTFLFMFLNFRKQEFLFKKKKNLYSEKTRLSDIIINILNDDSIDDEKLKEIKSHIINDYNSFFSIFKEYYPHFIHKVNEKAPSLVPEEMEVIALLKLNYSTKEIATITKSSIRAIEAKKYRIRKKLQIHREQDISIFLQSL